MSAKSKTWRDRLLMTAMIVPPVILVAFCSLAAAKWQSGEPKIRTALEQIVGDDLLNEPSPSGAAYNSRTNTDRTTRYLALTSAVDVLNEKYSHLFTVVDEDWYWYGKTDQDRPYAPFLNAYLQEAQPLLAETRALGDVSDVWIPNESGNPYSYNNSLIATRDIKSMLKLEFKAAVQAGDSARALDTITVIETRGIVSALETNQELRPLVTDSILSGIWNESDLDALDEILSKPDDFQQHWNESTRGSILGSTRWLLDGIQVDSWRPDPVHTTYAPSTRLKWIERAERAQSVRGVGTMRAIRELVELEKEHIRNNSSDLDTAVQLPSYGQFQNLMNHLYLAKRYVQIANDRRVARTAIAIAKYKLKNDAYPAKLSDLAQIGFDMNQALDPLDRPFHYKSDNDGATLGNASKWFTPRMGTYDSYSSADDSLSSALQHFRELRFGSHGIEFIYE